MFIRLDLADRVVEIEATPLQASIAELYEKRDKWSVADLGQRLGINDEEIVTNALTWWAEQGVLKDNGGTWALLETIEDAPAAPGLRESNPYTSTEREQPLCLKNLELTDLTKTKPMGYGNSGL